MTTRRDFLKAGAGAAGAAALGSALPSNLFTAELTARRSIAPLRILILGGTGFIGPHLVRHAIARGHTVTTFTRGRRTPELPAAVVQLIGDRNGQLDALRGKTWDIVFDDSATNPDWVRQSTELLKGSVGRYSFTSSTGVYYPYTKRGFDESDAPHLEQADTNDGSETFGMNKAKCEAQVRAVFGEKSMVVRPSSMKRRERRSIRR